MSDNIKILNDFDFDQTIEKAEVPVLVDFWASWCTPCKMQAPILHELSDDLEGKVIIAKVNVDECEAIANKFGISSIPSLFVFKGGEVVAKKVGLTSKAELSEMLIKLI